MPRNKRSGIAVKKSTRVLQSLVVLGFVILISRLVQLQIIDYDTYAPLSMKNSLRMEIVDASRGIITDRHQTILVENTPVYTISVTPSLFDTTNIPLLSTLSGYPEDEIKAQYKKARAYSWHRTSILIPEVPFPVFSAIQENIWQLPGVGHRIGSRRNYPAGVLAPHIFGYMREASPEDLERESALKMGEKVGRSGLELTYQSRLRGDDGARYVRVNAYGASLGEFPVDGLDKTPERGAHLTTTLDAELQKLGETLMAGKTGAIVAMDPSTGEILSMVSAPMFDPAKMSESRNADYWKEINSDSLTPLFNRAISSRQPPGSTFKPFMGLFGMDINLITPTTEITSTGPYIRGRAYGDTADPGVYDLEKALAMSSNYYFFWMMERIASRGYLNRWSQRMKDVGMGGLTGIDLPFERSGIMPDSTWMNQTFGVRKWGIGDLMSLGIGQGMVSVSPLQMAVATSVIANGGYVVKPHVVREIVYEDEAPIEVLPERRRVSWINEADLRPVKRGMRRVVTEGGGRFYVNMKDIDVAGKTGTAQNPHGQDHGWFVSFAPLDDPQIVVAVLMENAGFGSISAAPVASLMIEQYLKGRIERERVLDYVLNFKPRPLETDGADGGGGDDSAPGGGDIPGGGDATLLITGQPAASGGSPSDMNEGESSINNANARTIDARTIDARTIDARPMPELEQVRPSVQQGNTNNSFLRRGAAGSNPANTPAPEPTDIKPLESDPAESDTVKTAPPAINPPSVNPPPFEP